MQQIFLGYTEKAWNWGFGVQEWEREGWEKAEKEVEREREFLHDNCSFYAKGFRSLDDGY